MASLPLDHRSIVAEESAQFRALVAAGPADAMVPGCPEWTLEELGRHLADVQGWAAWILTTGEQGEPPPLDPPPANAADALARSTQTLLDALAASDPDEPCWNFSTLAPQRKAFWFRRQAIEVSLHRWDAESVTSDDPAPIPTAVAVDAIDEFVRLLLPRVVDREGIDLGSLDAADASDLHVHCTDTSEVPDGAGEWTVDVVDGRLQVTAEHRKSAVAVRGEASNVVLYLYNRVGADAVEVFGDQAVLDLWAPVLRF